MTRPMQSTRRLTPRVTPFRAGAFLALVGWIVAFGLVAMISTLNR